MSEQRLSTPGAIVLAGGIVGVCLLIGLRRERVPEPPAAPAEGLRDRPAAQAPSRSAPEVAPNTPLRATPSPAHPQATAGVDLGKAENAAKLALEAQHAALKSACWDPAPQGEGVPKVVIFFVSVTFDATGHQIARAVSEDPNAARPDVTACVERTLTPLTIAPPGGTASVEVPLQLP